MVISYSPSCLHRHITRVTHDHDSLKLFSDVAAVAIYRHVLARTCSIISTPFSHSTKLASIDRNCRILLSNCFLTDAMVTIYMLFLHHAYTVNIYLHECICFHPWETIYLLSKIFLYAYICVLNVYTDMLNFVCVCGIEAIYTLHDLVSAWAESSAHIRKSARTYGRMEC